MQTPDKEISAAEATLFVFVSLPQVFPDLHVAASAFTIIAEACVHLCIPFYLFLILSIYIVDLLRYIQIDIQLLPSSLKLDLLRVIHSGLRLG